MELLMKLPRERWVERDDIGYTFLHYACCGPNLEAAVALVQSGLVDVNARNPTGITPAYDTIFYKQPRALEVMCAMGADLRARSNDNDAPIDCAVMYAHTDDGAPVHVLVANGVRLNTVRRERFRFITPKLVAFERGVLRCRTAVAAMLRVKWAGQLWRWDKFLLRELAYALWATRYDEKWHGERGAH